MSSPLGIPGLLQPEVIGRGGFGTVYRVSEPEFGREVAVKIIQDRVDDDNQRRAFVRECRAMGTLSGHPHIVTVHRGGTTEHGEPYIVMDLMAAGSLADRLAGEGALPWNEVLEIGVAVAGALETAHRTGILHLDVKPANVLMSRYGEPKLADFGISRMPGVTATTDGRIAASIAFAAPERLLDGTAVPASDIYALGATLHTLLTGEPAFATKPGEDLLVAIARIVREPVPDLRTQGVPDPLALVVERLMAKSPLDRFATASDAAFALQAAQRACGRPVTKAVVEGAAGTGGDTATWAMLPPGRWALGASVPTDGPPVRPSYVPQTRSPAAVSAPARHDPPAGPMSVSDPAARTLVEQPPDRMPIDRPNPLAPTAPTLRAPIAPGAREPHPARRSRRPLVLALAVAGVLTVGAGGGALLVSRTSAVPQVPVPGSTPVAATTTPPGPTTAAPTAGSPTAVPPTNLRITVADDVRHPQRDVVAAHLDGYFQAVNDHDFATAFAYFAPDSLVVRNGFDAFRDGYSTTTVQRERITAISDLGADRVQATVTYRSRQSAEFGPDGATCTNWRLAYELVGPDRLIRRAKVVTDPQPC